jgi:hypothetical protein
VLGGVVSFAGWAADLPRLTDWNDGGISIQPNATIAAFTSGVAILLLFLAGVAYGRVVGRNPWIVGLSMVALGSVLVALTIALGG